MIVIKYGGHAMSDTDGHFAEAVQATLDSGQECLIVHGGGPQIDTAMANEGIEPSFVGGFRFTTQDIFQIVERTLTGVVAPNVVAKLRSRGINAVGISGRDGGVLIARKLTTLVNEVEADLGLVGEVIRVDATYLQVALDAGFLPVLSPIAVLGDEVSEDSSVGLNVNADLAAGAIAGAFQADSLIILTDVPGIYSNWPDKSSLISTISVTELREMQNSFHDGMLPKVFACINAIESGTKSVRIIDGTNSESFGLALRGIGGTVVTP